MFSDMMNDLGVLVIIPLFFILLVLGYKKD